MILATVSSDPAFSREVREVLAGSIRFEAVWDLGYEDVARLRALEDSRKCMAVVDYGEPGRARAVVRAGNGREQSALIDIGGGRSREELLELMRAGICDVIPHFTCREMLQAADRATARLRLAGEALADLYAFVPAKPGCGATTIATHAMAVAAGLGEQPILLLDFDVRLGMTTFLLQAESTHSVVDALLRASELDEEMRSNLVSKHGNLHLLGSGPVDYSRPIDATRFTALVDFALRRYGVVSVDLPGSMEECECDVLIRAKRIFLVCTPDIGALHVARRKSVWMRDLHLSDKVSVVVNCANRRGSLSVADIERVIQLPVRYMLPESASEIARAVGKGAVLDGSSPLARQILRIAGEIACTPAVTAKAGAMRRFVEYFSISPEREGRLEKVGGAGR